MASFTPLAWSLALAIAIVLGDRLIAWRLAVRVQKRIFARADRLPHCRVALVLGCPPQRPDGRPNRYLTARLAAARQLFESGQVERLRLSGIGDEAGPADDEIEAMRTTLLSGGIPADALDLDPGARRTIDSIRRAARALAGERVVVVSQPFHLIRALLLADAAGLPISIGFAAGELRPPRHSREALREGFARWRSLIDALRLRVTR